MEEFLNRMTDLKKIKNKIQSEFRLKLTVINVNKNFTNIQYSKNYIICNKKHILQ